MRRKGFTLVELLVVIAIISILLSILVPAIGAIREYARQVACRSNMNNAGKALTQYTSAEGGSFPFISNEDDMNYDTDMVEGGADDPFGLDEGSADATDSGEQKNLNMLENLNLLMSEDLADWKVFICPSTGNDVMQRGELEGGTNYNYGFADYKGDVHMDYAYQIGYDNTTDGDNSAPLTENLPSQVAILADKPGNDVEHDFGKEYEDEGQTKTNTGTGYAHSNEGVNYLTAAGNAKWSDGTIFCGWGSNNIYLEDMDTDNEVKTGSGDFTTPDESKYDSVLYHVDHPDATAG